MTNAWPENKPDTLENICLGVCAQNPQTFSVQDDYGRLLMKPGVDILPGVIDKLVSTLQQDDILDIRWLNLFQDTSATRLTRIDLSGCNVEERDLNIVTNHPLQELILTNAVLPINTVECINKLSRTLRILKFENFEQDTDITLTSILTELVEGDPQIKDGDNRHFGKDFIINTPNLRILSLRDCDFKEPDFCIFGALLNPLTRLTHLDLSRCFLDAEHLKCLEQLRSLMWFNFSNVIFNIEIFREALEYICKCKNLR